MYKKISIWSSHRLFDSLINQAVSLGYICLARVKICMQFIPRILEKDQVMTVQADASVAFALMKQILHNVNNTQISVMRSFSKQVHDPIIFSGFNHLVVNDNQVTYVDI